MLPGRKGIMVLLRMLPVLIEVGLLVYCLVNVIQTPADEVRNLPKVVWILLIVLLPLIGGIAWLVAGRPAARRQGGWRVGGGFPESERPRPPAPDDDAEFLARMRQIDEQHEQALRRWKENLDRREAEQERDRPDDGREGPAPSA